MKNIFNLCKKNIDWYVACRENSKIEYPIKRGLVRVERCNIEYPELPSIVINSKAHLLSFFSSSFSFFSNQIQFKQFTNHVSDLTVSYYII